MNNNDLEMITPSLMAIDAKTVVAPNMPIPSFLQEAENLDIWMQEDIAALKQAGLEDRIADGLQTRIGALGPVAQLRLDALQLGACRDDGLYNHSGE